MNSMMRCAKESERSFKFKDVFEKSKLGLSIEVMNFMSDWLINHIKSVDKKYGPFFN